MVGRGGNGGVAALRGVYLPCAVFIPSPALELPALVDCAGGAACCADGGIAPLWWGGGSPIRIEPVDFSPALDLPALAQRAGVPAAGADGAVCAAAGRVGLPEIVDSPAREIPALAQRAGVQVPRADGAKAAFRGVALPVVKVSAVSCAPCSPARDLPALADRAAVIAAGADGDVASGVCGGADRDLRAPQPSPYPRAGREVARLWRDPLPVRRRERKLDPAVAQQARVDPANLRAVYLYGAAPQPAVYRRVGREVALARQHSRAAGRLPAEFDAAILKESRHDPAGRLVLALRGGGGRQVGGDDRGDGG